MILAETLLQGYVISERCFPNPGMIPVPIGTWDIMASRMNIP